ncbi:hypothetical protein DICPUDRAFT_151708 [Dictyostelium purpureum]|uniref:hydroxyacylglutathione hydrolase n=1 Tax=Dictyostelium purpureum TaxID=5786 RepID=F0ZJK3_DICPU|nr:uncharacterized protein DICPUDRAFT_151708 [Dictyostelium purpureum]EGC35877.1 hypothetical protein DICPUDRAFT_151708 [Dictyostelium purpureum]|eukprot:XP_003287608.1 hypothetical protein DICPUDRAFT_151708 [Dictyostelium purpureum]
MKVIPVLVNRDNYSYLLVDEKNKLGVAIDPCEPTKIISAAPKDIQIENVFTTHHHWDHAGGNNQIKELIKGVKIYGGDERIEGITNKLNDGDTIKIGSLTIKTLKAPAHTSGHVLYYVLDEEEPNKSVLFTGDTLFIGGCGRLFEGDPKQMYHALYEIIGKLPEETLVYVGHEYTLNNLKFALTLESDNNDLNSYFKQVEKMVANQQPTVPSTISNEKKINPFMRCHLPSIYNNYLKANPQSQVPPDTIAVLGYIRELKDKF